MKQLILAIALLTAQQAHATIGQTNEWTCINERAEMRVEIQRLSLVGANPPITTLLGVQQQSKHLMLTMVQKETTDTVGNSSFQAKEAVLLIAPNPKDNVYPARIRVGSKTTDLNCYKSVQAICGTLIVTNAGGTLSYKLVTGPFHVPKASANLVFSEYPVTEATKGVLNGLKTNQPVCLESRDFSLEQPTTLRAISLIK